MRKTYNANENRKRLNRISIHFYPEPSLTVSELSPTHIAVLNKFNVVNHHLLIVTSKFESQERLLNECDVDAFKY
ncbi:MAG: hypothetical protein ABW157_17270 [Candidatus Thiodiazotropha sp. LLP2]